MTSQLNVYESSHKSVPCNYETDAGTYSYVHPFVFEDDGDAD